MHHHCLKGPHAFLHIAPAPAPRLYAVTAAAVQTQALRVTPTCAVRIVCRPLMHSQPPCQVSRQWQWLLSWVFLWPAHPHSITKHDLRARTSSGTQHRRARQDSYVSLLAAQQGSNNRCFNRSMHPPGSHTALTTPCQHTPKETDSWCHLARRCAMLIGEALQRAHSLTTALFCFA